MDRLQLYIVRMNTNFSLSLHTLAMDTLDSGMSQLQAPGPGSDKGARLGPAAL